MTSDIKSLFPNINCHKIPFFENIKNTIVLVDNIYRDDLSILSNSLLSKSSFQINEKQVININLNKSFQDFLHIVHIGKSKNNNSFELNIILDKGIHSNVFLSFVDDDKSNIRGIINFVLNDDTNITTKALYINNYSSEYKINIISHHVSSYSISQLMVKGVLYDSASVDFNMKIIVDKFLKAVSSSELHKVLKLSDSASIKSVPAIICNTPDTEIHHGFALSGIDKKSINFLKSRGINKINSENILIDSFISSI